MRMRAALPDRPDLSHKWASISTGLQRRCLPSMRGCHVLPYVVFSFFAHRPPPFHARGRRGPDRARRRASVAVRRLRPGPALERQRSVLARRRLGRAAARWLRAVDAACARSAVARSGDTGRYDRRRRAGDLRDRRRSGDARHRAPRHRDCRAHVRLLRACGRTRTVAGALLLVPLRVGRRREPGRPRRRSCLAPLRRAGAGAAATRSRWASPPARHGRTASCCGRDLRPIPCRPIRQCRAA